MLQSSIRLLTTKKSAFEQFRLGWIAFLLTILTNLHAQSPFGFIYNSSIQAYDLNDSNPLSNAWTGGFNAPQFNECELNGDNLLDLIVFDRTGNKLLCFTRNSDGNSFRFAPEFESVFPKLHDWMSLRDYNKDGKPDIFASGGNGIEIYRNTSPSTTTTQFSKVVDLVYSDYGPSSLNLYVSPVDFPAIDDVDGDGDLDIVTFYILGTCVEYHRNLSQELYGHSDSLRFELVTGNWGKFTESSLDNSINFQDSCGRNAGVRHSGSTLLLDDFDQDGDPDLLLGDVSYPDIHCLMNIPNAGVDVMNPLPSSYPSAYSNFLVTIFPGAYRIHANNDTLPDLILAPNTDFQSLNKGRLALLHPSNETTYRYTGNESTFLSADMIDLGRGAYPCFIDNDNDGDLDLIVGNYGEFEPNVNPVQEGNYRASLQLFENTGSNLNPEYKLRNNDLAQLRSLNSKHLAPAAADLNGDGKTDLVVGNIDGSLTALIRNSSGNDFTISNGIVNTITADQYATPCFADLNQDGKVDLIVGGKLGKLSAYLNNGTTNSANFSSTVISDLGAVETIEEGQSNYGYSSPAFFKNSQGSFVFSGSESGRLFIWRMNESDFTAPFETLDSSLARLDVGSWTALTLSDLNTDGFPEMVLGNKRGGLNFLQGTFPQSLTEINTNKSEYFEVFPNPTRNEFSIQASKAKFPATIELFDVTGRRIHHELIGQNNSVISVETQESGVYFICLKDSNSKDFRSKVVISR